MSGASIRLAPSGELLLAGVLQLLLGQLRRS